LALLLGAQEHGQLDDYGIVELARSARRLAAWAASLEFGAIAELSARRKVQGERLGAWDSEVGEWVADEVAAALTLSRGAAAHRVVVAQQLAADLPGTCRALADGRIDADKATVIADGVRGSDAAVAARVEQQVLPAAPAQTCAQLRHAVRTAVRDADPQAHEQRRKAAEEARRVELWDADDGTSDLAGRNLPATAAHAASNRINAIAQALKADGDPRTIDQLRADVYLALLRNERLEPPVRPVEQVDQTVRLRSGEVSDQASEDAARCGESAAGADVGGVGAVDEEQAVAAAVAGALSGQLAQLTDHLGRDGRKLGGQAALVREAARRMQAAITDLRQRWCITVSDSDGVVVRHGADSYRVPAAMRRALQIRDKTCRFPGCRRRADNCDADHTVAHHKGGPTCPCNVAILCRRHHRLKQRPEWQLIQVWHGVLL
jgi:hypothetical protein